MAASGAIRRRRAITASRDRVRAPGPTASASRSKASAAPASPISPAVTSRPTSEPLRAVTGGTRRMKHPLSLAALALVALAGTRLAAQHVAPVGGAATAASVTLLGVTNTAGQALLPDTGGLTSTDVDALQIPGQVAIDALTSITSGAHDQKRSSAQSVTHLENVNILNGLIQASTIIAVASSSLSSAGATSNAFGSSLTDLVVNGVPI